MTAINTGSVNGYYKENGTNTGGKTSVISTQTEKIIRDDLDEDMDEDDPDRFKPADDFEVIGLDAFLSRVYPKMSKILEKNAANDILAGYDVIWEDELNEDTELVHKLKTEYDFHEANNATLKAVQKLKEADGADDFEDDFDEYAPAKEEAKGEAKGDQQYQVTGIAWSCNGSSLAVAYGKTDHVSWCEH